MIDPDTNLPPGTRAQDVSDRQRRREETEDDDFWRDYWLYATDRREREESQHGNDGEPHE